MDTVEIPFASPAQARFIRDMLADIFADAPAGTADAVLARNIDAGMFASYADMKAALESLIVKRDAVRVARRTSGKSVAVTGPSIAEGYYAVTRNGAIYFYKVVEGKGRWAGRTFVNRFKSDEELRVSRTESDDVRRLIAADPEAARMLFARELTRCYVCGRMLTDDESRELGIGPVCREK